MSTRGRAPDQATWRPHHPGGRPVVADVVAEVGLVVEEPGSDFCGAIVGCDPDAVHLHDRHGHLRVFPLSLTFLMEGRPVRLIRARPATERRRPRSASGSTVAPDQRARIALASRIYVEGSHDADLVEKIWGHDLRNEGVVVEPLHGIDDLPAVVGSFGPAAGRRLGVLVDHLVPGSKESRIADQVAGSHLLVVGHPFVDIWQAVRPEVLGIRSWPDVARGRPWKEGICAQLGWKLTPGQAWQHILSRVTGYADLEPELLGRVEELIDFVTSSD